MLKRARAGGLLHVGVQRVVSGNRHGGEADVWLRRHDARMAGDVRAQDSEIDAGTDLARPRFGKNLFHAKAVAVVVNLFVMRTQAEAA